MLGISGGLRIDYIITLEGTARLREFGGNAIFAAAGARLWVDQVNIISRAGENYPAAWLQQLEQAGLTAGGIRVLPGPHEHRTFYAYVDQNTRDDTHPEKHFAHIGQPLPPDLVGYVKSSHGQASAKDIDPLAVMPEDIAGSLQAYHLAPMALQSHLLAPAGARKAGASTISVDPGERYMVPRLAAEVERVLAQCDVFLPSAMEVESFFETPLGDMAQTLARMRWFAQRGPRIVVFKLGSDGSMLYERDANRAWHLPALPVRVVDVTGAGDSYCGGFIGHFSEHANPLEAAIAGTVSASLAIEDYGAMHMLAANSAERDRRAEVVRRGIRAVIEN